MITAAAQLFVPNVRSAADSYRSSRRALLALDSEGSWTAVYHALSPGDVWFPGLDDNDKIDPKIARLQNLSSE